MIRAAEMRDHATLVAGNRAMALETEGMELDPSILAAGVRAVLEDHSRGRYFVLEEDDEVLAQLMLTFEWSDWRNREVWWIQSVYVLPKARGRGCYRALYEHVRGCAREAGVCGLRLYVDTRNEKAQKVYAALGMDGGHYRVYEQMFD